MMSKSNGNVCVGIPLFRIQQSESLGKMEGYNIILTNDEPVAWVLDAGYEGAMLINADSVERNMEIIGDL